MTSPAARLLAVPLLLLFAFLAAPAPVIAQGAGAQTAGGLSSGSQTSPRQPAAGSENPAGQAASDSLFKGTLSAAPAPAAPQPARAEQARGITATIARWATGVIGAVGYLGVFLAMAAESMVFPVPAEGVMPFAGFLVADGRFSLLVVILVATFGSLCGSLVSWFVGQRGGRPFVLRFGKWVLLDRRDLEMTERFFNRRGEVTILISRFIPVVRHLISLPAGLAEMNLLRFSFCTVIGAGIYNSFLAVAGVYLKEHWDRIMRYSHEIDIVVVVIITALVAWYIARHVLRLMKDRRTESEGRA